MRNRPIELEHPLAMFVCRKAPNGGWVVEGGVDDPGMRHYLLAAYSDTDALLDGLRKNLKAPLPAPDEEQQS